MSDMPPPDPNDQLDPGELAHLKEMERQNVANALDKGEQLIWADGSTATVIERLDRADELAAEVAQLRSERARLILDRDRARADLARYGGPDRVMVTRELLTEAPVELLRAAGAS